MCLELSNPGTWWTVIGEQTFWSVCCLGILAVGRFLLRCWVYLEKGKAVCPLKLICAFPAPSLCFLLYSPGTIVPFGWTPQGETLSAPAKPCMLCCPKATYHQFLPTPCVSSPVTLSSLLARLGLLPTVLWDTRYLQRTEPRVPQCVVGQ